MPSLIVVARPARSRTGNCLRKGAPNWKSYNLTLRTIQAPARLRTNVFLNTRAQAQRASIPPRYLFHSRQYHPDVLMMWGGPGALITRQSASGAPWFRAFDDQSQAAHLAFIRVWNVRSCQHAYAMRSCASAPAVVCSHAIAYCPLGPELVSFAQNRSCFSSRHRDAEHRQTDVRWVGRARTNRLPKGGEACEMI